MNGGKEERKKGRRFGGVGERERVREREKGEGIGGVGGGEGN
jgi:hypothetical protein